MKKIISRIGVAACMMIILAACQTNTESDFQRDATAGMLQHTVFFYLHDDVSEEDLADFEQGLAKLLAIPEIYYAELGVPAATEERDVVDHNFGYAIFTWFENLSAHDVYQEHPDHIAFVENYSHLWADVKVYDTEIVSK